MLAVIIAAARPTLQPGVSQVEQPVTGNGVVLRFGRRLTIYGFYGCRRIGSVVGGTISSRCAGAISSSN